MGRGLGIGVCILVRLKKRIRGGATLVRAVKNMGVRLMLRLMSPLMVCVILF